MMRKALLFILLLSPLYAMPQVSKNLYNSSAVQMKKLNQFFSYLNNLYIDTVNNEQLVEKAIIDVLAELDPHSNYTSREEMIAVRESFDGRFSGIGVQINTLYDTLRVVNVISGGPSEKVGVMPNDRIVEVDDQSVVGMKQTETVKLLRGPKGSFVMINVVRPGVADKLSFRIKRDNISIETIDGAYMIAPKTGYIRVNRFAHTTMDEFSEAFDKMNKPDALILDLRSNGGGLLDQAIGMANFFLPKGAVIVSTEGRMVPSEVLNARTKPEFPKGKVVVLIDEFSASGSEIVAGALQDWDRAVIIGRRSFGKGLVQRQMPLIDGSAVSITISKYLTPTGRAIQRPFEKGDKTGYYQDLAARLKTGYIDTLDTNTAERFETLRLGKTVYGGGGIYPDYYVHADTMWYSEYYAQLTRKGLINEYINIYLDNHRNEVVETYKNFETFKSLFEVTDPMLDGLTDLGEKNNIPKDKMGFENSTKTLRKIIKAGIAQAIWGTNASTQVYNADDNIIRKTLEVIANWDTEAKGIALTN